ncbi:MAG: hypothetical protein KDA84_02555 [Planctomycetaceae bacterium]|nr:hypothetical protein [Planctomycetaceae bacterium]
MKTQQCPSKEELSAYHHGDLPWNQGETIGDHLEQCQPCSGWLDRIEEEADSLIRQLREEIPAEILQEDSEIRRLSDLAVGLQETAAATITTHMDNQSDHETDLQLAFTKFISPSESEDEIGRVGNYRIIELLGSGGMGIVFRAEDTVLHRQVALKVIRPTDVHRDSAKQRFLREARAAAAIEDDHIVPVYQVDEQNGYPLPGHATASRRNIEGEIGPRGSA